MRRVVLVLLAALALPATARGAEPPPWRGADQVRDALFDAQAEMIVGTRASSERLVEKASHAYGGRLRAGIRASDPAADRSARRALANAHAAVVHGDDAALAAARGAARAAIF